MVLRTRLSDTLVGTAPCLFNLSHLQRLFLVLHVFLHLSLCFAVVISSFLPSFLPSNLHFLFLSTPLSFSRLVSFSFWYIFFSLFHSLLSTFVPSFLLAFLSILVSLLFSASFLTLVLFCWQIPRHPDCTGNTTSVLSPGHSLQMSARVCQHFPKQKTSQTPAIIVSSRF